MDNPTRIARLKYISAKTEYLLFKLQAAKIKPRDFNAGLEEIIKEAGLLKMYLKTWNFTQSFLFEFNQKDGVWSMYGAKRPIPDEVSKILAKTADYASVHVPVWCYGYTDDGDTVSPPDRESNIEPNGAATVDGVEVDARMLIEYLYELIDKKVESGSD